MSKAERIRKREEWQEKVAEFRASGLSGAAWCTAEGIKQLDNNRAERRTGLSP